MPQNNKRAPKPFRASTDAGRKPGSKSAKHRGFRPDDAARPAAKKPRWNADERVARGAQAERPRGAKTRDAAPARDGRPVRENRGFDSGRGREDRGYGASKRTAEGRPNWEPRGKDAKQAPERPARRFDDHGDRPQRTERPARRFDDRGARPRYDRDERPARRYDDRPQRDDRPRRTFEDRPHHAERPTRQLRERAEHYVERTPRRDESHTPYVPTDDVVLERLEAQAITAGDAEGVTFADLGLGQNIVNVLSELGAESPFPIQAATIPDVLEGRDVLGRGRTGSGKTIAFGAPLVERLLQMQAESNQRREFGRAPRALILAPTRELALQIDRTVQPIARSVGLFTTQIYGGVPYARQLGALQRGVDIVIGTPGRVGDLATQGKLDLSKTVITVLDEADHMCELGFAEPVQEILDLTAGGGQKLMFSATLDKGVAEIVEKYLVDPSVHEVAGEDQASSTIDHKVLLLDQRDKQQVLIELASGPGKKLVFARTRAFAEMLADLLDEAGLRAESIHGDLTQSRRQRALDKLTSGRVDILVATDVAARGIHVDDIALVIQADAPDEYKAYLHRSGRTGRAGKEGRVVTLVPRNRRRRTEELLARAEITADWIPAAPGDAVIAELAGN